MTKMVGSPPPPPADAGSPGNAPPGFLCDATCSIQDLAPGSWARWCRPCATAGSQGRSMDGKNALVAVLAAVVAILANAGLGRTTAAPPRRRRKRPRAPINRQTGRQGGPASPAAPAPGATGPRPNLGLQRTAPCRVERRPHLPARPRLPAGAGESAAPPRSSRGAAGAGVARVAAEPAGAVSRSAAFDRGIEASSARSRASVSCAAAMAPLAGADSGKPGWMLFRRDDECAGKVKMRLLLVLVVSERPDSGVEPRGARGALTRFKAIAARRRVATPDLVPGAVLLGQAQSWSSRQAPGARPARGVLRARSWRRCRGRDPPAHAGDHRGADGVFQGSSSTPRCSPTTGWSPGCTGSSRSGSGFEAKEIAELTETSTDYGNAVATNEGPSAAGGGKPAAAAHDGASSLKIALPLHVDVLADLKEEEKADCRSRPAAPASSWTPRSRHCRGTASTTSASWPRRRRTRCSWQGGCGSRRPTCACTCTRAASSLPIPAGARRWRGDGRVVVSGVRETQLWRRRGPGPCCSFVGVGRGDLQRPPRPAGALRPGAWRRGCPRSCSIIARRSATRDRRSVGVGHGFDLRTTLAAGRCTAGRWPRRRRRRRSMRRAHRTRRPRPIRICSSPAVAPRTTIRRRCPSGELPDADRGGGRPGPDRGEPDGLPPAGPKRGVARAAGQSRLARTGMTGRRWRPTARATTSPCWGSGPGPRRAGHRQGPRICRWVGVPADGQRRRRSSTGSRSRWCWGAFVLVAARAC